MRSDLKVEIQYLQKDINAVFKELTRLREFATKADLNKLSGDISKIDTDYNVNLKNLVSRKSVAEEIDHAIMLHEEKTKADYNGMQSELHKMYLQLVSKIEKNYFKLVGMIDEKIEQNFSALSGRVEAAIDEFQKLTKTYETDSKAITRAERAIFEVSDKLDGSSGASGVDSDHVSKVEEKLKKNKTVLD